MILRPVSDGDLVGERRAQLGGALRCLHHVVESQSQTGRTGLAAREPGGVLERHQRERSVVILQANLEDAGDDECLQHRSAAGGKQ